MSTRTGRCKIESFRKMEEHNPLQSTFNGFINTMDDAMAVIRACLQGYLQHLPRGLSNSDRDRLLRSGSVFVYETGCSGITTWNDGLQWEPAQEYNGFYIYRMVADTTSFSHQGRVLPKKTTSVKIGRCVHRLVAYYYEHDMQL